MYSTQALVISFYSLSTNCFLSFFFLNQLWYLFVVSVACYSLGEKHVWWLRLCLLPHVHIDKHMTIGKSCTPNSWCRCSIIFSISLSSFRLAFCMCVLSFFFNFGTLYILRFVLFRPKFLCYSGNTKLIQNNNWTYDKLNTKKAYIMPYLLTLIAVYMQGFHIFDTILFCCVAAKYCRILWKKTNKNNMYAVRSRTTNAHTHRYEQRHTRPEFIVHLSAIFLLF